MAVTLQVAVCMYFILLMTKMDRRCFTTLELSAEVSMGKQIAFIMSAQEIAELLTRLKERNAYIIDEYFRELSIHELDMDSLNQFFVGYPSSRYQTALDGTCNLNNFFTLAEYWKQHIRSEKPVVTTTKYDFDKRLCTLTSDVIEITLGGKKSLGSNAVAYIDSRVFIDSSAPDWLKKEYNYIANYIRRTACLRHQRAVHYVVYVSQNVVSDMKENGSIIL